MVVWLQEFGSSYGHMAVTRELKCLLHWPQMQLLQMSIIPYFVNKTSAFSLINSIWEKEGFRYRIGLWIFLHKKCFIFFQIVAIAVLATGTTFITSTDNRQTFCSFKLSKANIFYLKNIYYLFIWDRKQSSFFATVKHPGLNPGLLEQTGR